MNYAKQAMNNHDEARRQSRGVNLDHLGQPVSPINPWGNPWQPGAIRSAQESRSYEVYQGAMTFLDEVIGDDRDTATRKAFDQAKSKFSSESHAEEMKEKLVVAALNGANAALIAYAAACVYLNPYATVDFSWYVNGQEVATENPFAGALSIIKDAQGRQLTALKDGRWFALSSTTKDVHYVNTAGTSCSCKGHKFNGHCWHTKLARSVHQKEVSEVLEKTPLSPNKYEKARKEREQALPVSRKRRRGARKMWKVSDLRRTSLSDRFLEEEMQL